MKEPSECKSRIRKTFVRHSLSGKSKVMTKLQTIGSFLVYHA